ncbi:thiamine phosphate synthase [Sporosarcina sp. G11-34]|uniref:thiamine phosphate synthase n=1 Tax=Sporosarcina sp. G11-34 TaxID=2849605 RepID=UPI0022A98E5D|nr:thiamine phosphate synthase [Sporosarcina sp. G11-34]MCZ2259180.1 thiamine phosphate synthase [Sporosarcina sp. G11-34]
MSNNNLKLYFVMRSKVIGGSDPLAVLEGALKGGVTCFQLREKGPDALSGAKLEEFAIQCKSLCKEYGVPFIISGDVDLAVKVGADGIHLEQEEIDFSRVREKLGQNMSLGVSVHTASEAFAAADAGASYIEIGPLFESKEKVNRPTAKLELIREVAFQLPGLPIVGCGGITERKMGSVIRAGASCVAVSSVITDAENPEEAARQLKGQVLLSLTGVEM